MTRAHERCEHAGPRAGVAERERVVATMLAVMACVLAYLVAAPNALAAGWLAPQDLSVVSGTNVLPPRVAVDPQGNAVAIWLKPIGSTGSAVVQVAQRAANGAWQGPIDVSSTARDGSEPEIALDSSGNAYALWPNSDGVNVRVEASFRPAGGSWQAPVEISAAGRNAAVPRLAVDAAGTAIAVFQRYDGTNQIIQAAVRPAGGGWQAATNLSAAGRDAFQPAVSVNPQGAAVAVWQRSNGTNLMIQASSWAPGGAWQAPVDLSATGQDGIQPQVAVDPNGGAVAVWERQRVVQSAVRPPGSGWQAATNVSAPCGVPPVARIAVSPQGTAAAIWTCFVGSSTAIQSSLRPAGGSWDAPVNLTPGGFGMTPRITFDPSGKAIAMWTVANRWVVQSASRPAGGGWQPTIDVTANGAVSSEPQIAVDSRGNAVGVWRRYDGSKYIAQGARFDAEGPLLAALAIPATGAVGKALVFSVSPFDAWSALGATSWNFGDGGGAVGTAASHAYGAPGTYTVTVMSVDALGNASAAARPVTITSGAGGSGGDGTAGGTGTGTGDGTGGDGSGGTPSGTGSRVAAISGLGLSRTAFRVPRSGATVIAAVTKTGTRVRYRLNMAGTVSFTVQRSTKGRRVGAKCVKTTARNSSHKSCKFYAAVRGQFTRSHAAGADEFTFSGRLGGHALAPGRYRLVATPAAAGHRGSSALAPFRVIR